MSLTSGTRLGPYDVVAKLGAGGMGEVYRARDTRLDRDVALKVLPAASLGNEAAEARERDGWTTECFAPSWFAFDGEPAPRPSAPSRIGADAPAILAELGYSAADVERLIAGGVVGPTEWCQKPRNI